LSKIKWAEQVLPGSKWVGGERRGGEGGGKERGEMAQTMYPHMNK
jgi:hypothetical protein